MQKPESLRADILALLREKRYEEALALLYRARAEAPGDPELQKSIEQIKQFLIGAYAKRLGGLDRVATPIPLPSVRSPDAVMLARYIDGTTTFGDVAQMCPLGQLRTLQVLVGLYSGVEPPRIEVPARKETDPPNSGLRFPDAPSSSPRTPVVPVGDEVEKAPDTRRSSTAAGTPVERPVTITEPDRYTEYFGLGTAAYIQRRFRDAIDAFEECLRLRPQDNAASVMLKRCQRGLESQ